MENINNWVIDKDGNRFPIVTHTEFHPALTNMLSKEVEYKICVGSSQISGVGTVVFGAGGNKDHLIIVVRDRDTGGKADMRFTSKDILGMTKFCLYLTTHTVPQVLKDYPAQIIYRPNRRFYYEALDDAQIFVSESEMFDYVPNEFNDIIPGAVNKEDLSIGEDIGADKRTGWNNNHYVLTKRMHKYIYDTPQCISMCSYVNYDEFVSEEGYVYKIPKVKVNKT